MGNMGLDRRIKYGVVGQAVNLASRVESFSVGGQILVSEATQKAVSASFQFAALILYGQRVWEGPLRYGRSAASGGNLLTNYRRHYQASQSSLIRFTCFFDRLWEKDTIRKGFPLR
jgi:hypothetical protein